MVSLCLRSALFLAAFCVGNPLQGAAPVRVFILAGQSNMEGQGVVDLNHEKYYNGGKGNLEYVMARDKTGAFKHLRDANGEWAVRTDVMIRFQTRHGLKKGGLGIGFTSYPEKHHIGPELQIGHRLGDHFESPVLLIKTAWGGKSLYKDFRPPSSGGVVGPYYQQMNEEIETALKSVPRDFPHLKGRDLELAGFFWFQGWNDMYNDDARVEYEQNLVNLINDVRKRFHRPDLPVIIGELGNGGEATSPKMAAIRVAQKSAAARAEFKGSVRFVKTTSFARPKTLSPNVSHGHHWFGNAESYFLIGDALGKAMVDLQKNRSASNPPR